MKTTFILHCAITIICLASCKQTELGKVEVQKPNILWLSVEDISPLLAAYGDSTANTPVLNKLARESMVFTQAYATVPVCAPSRSSLITGMYPASIGTLHMRTATDYVGWGNRKYLDKSASVDISGDTIRHYAAVIPPEVKCFTEYMRMEGYFCTNNAKTDYQFAAPVTAWDENGSRAHWKNRPEGVPFFSVFNHNVTHESRMWMNADKPLTVSPESVPLPSYFPDTETVRKDVARNYSNIELMDQQIGEKLNELEESGLIENTIIFFFSDHGGPLPRGKREPYVSGLHVPFMVRFPKQFNKTGYTDELVSFVDFAPTVLSLAGIKPPNHMQGKPFLGEYKSLKKREYVFASADRFDAFSDMVRTVTDGEFMYVKNFYPDRPYYKDVAYRKQINMMNEMLTLNGQGELDSVSARWFNNEKVKEELYLIGEDRFNIRSVIHNPAYAQKLENLRNELEHWQARIDDKGFIPERQLIEQMWPDGIQPKTEKPVINKTASGYEFSSETEGASIAYLLSNTENEPTLDSGWKVYHQLVQPESDINYMYVMTTRIGYQDSDIVTIKLD